MRRRRVRVGCDTITDWLRCYAAPMKSPFIDLGLTKEFAQVLTGLGYEEPTPIQSEAIPPLLEGRDLLGQAATGTGKTAAFALPLLQRVLGGRAQDRASGRAGAGADARAGDAGGRGAAQVRRQARRVGAAALRRRADSDSRSGRSSAACDVVVATPGRALDHIRRGTLNLGALTAVVLDEADEMLDMGFAEDIERSSTRRRRRGRRRCSRPRCRRASRPIADKHLRDPVRVHRSRARRPARPASCRACGRSPTSCSARTRWPRSGACWT